MSRKKPDRKDELLLLLTAIGFSVIAWVFWHHVDLPWGLFIVSSLIAIGLLSNNRKLQKKLNERQDQNKP